MITKKELQGYIVAYNREKGVFRKCCFWDASVSPEIRAFKDYLDVHVPGGPEVSLEFDKVRLMQAYAAAQLAEMKGTKREGELSFRILSDINTRLNKELESRKKQRAMTRDELSQQALLEERAREQAREQARLEAERREQRKYYNLLGRNGWHTMQNPYRYDSPPVSPREPDEASHTSGDSVAPVRIKSIPIRKGAQARCGDRRDSAISEHTLGPATYV